MGGGREEDERKVRSFWKKKTKLLLEGKRGGTPRVIAKTRRDQVGKKRKKGGASLTSVKECVPRSEGGRGVQAIAMHMTMKKEKKERVLPETQRGGKKEIRNLKVKRTLFSKLTRVIRGKNRRTRAVPLEEKREGKEEPENAPGSDPTREKRGKRKDPKK